MNRCLAYTGALLAVSPLQAQKVDPVFALRPLGTIQGARPHGRNEVEYVLILGLVPKDPGTIIVHLEPKGYFQAGRDDGAPPIEKMGVLSRPDATKLLALLRKAETARDSLKLGLTKSFDFKGSAILSMKIRAEGRCAVTSSLVVGLQKRTMSLAPAQIGQFKALLIKGSKNLKAKASRSE